MVDLHFTYRDEPARLCCELKNLKEDEITVVLEALKQQFDTVEQGAFNFSIKEEKDYSSLQLTLRRRPYGEWVHSGFDNSMKFLLSMVSHENRNYTDEQQRWMNVRHAAQDFNREINQLREDLQSSSSILKRFSRDELLEHLGKIDPVVIRQKQREEAVEEEAPGGGEKEPGAVEGAENGDEKAPYVPAGWFKEEFGIPASRLRGARLREKLAAKDLSRDGERPSYHYSVPDAMQLWPTDVTYLPNPASESKK